MEFEDKKDRGPLVCSLFVAAILVFIPVFFVGRFLFEKLMVVHGMLEENMYWMRPIFTFFVITYILYKLNLYNLLIKYVKNGRHRQNNNQWF